MEENTSNVHDAINDVIEELTTTGKEDLNSDDMETLKSYCKSSHEYVKTAYNILVSQLEKEHAEVRWSTFQIIHELFIRSHLFRTLVIFDLQNIFMFTVETEPKSRPLPPPSKIAKKLKLHSLKTFYEWYKTFGKGYRKLELGYEFLKYVKKVRFTELHNLTVEQRRIEQEQKEKDERISKSKLEQVDIQFRDTYHDITMNVKQLENCFQLILPKVENFLTTSQSIPPGQNTLESQLQSCDQVNCSSSNSSSSSQTTDNISSHERGSETGIHKKYSVTISLPTRLQIQLSSDNKHVIQQTNELYKEITSQLTSVKRWLQVLLKCQSVDKDRIQKILELKNNMVSLLEKYDELDVMNEMTHTDEKDEDQDNIEEEEEDFIDVPEVKERRSHGSLSTDILQPSASSTEASTSTVETALSSTSRKEKLLKVAPVIPFDTDLQHWGKEKITAPSSHKFDSLHRFWKPAEHEESFVPPQLEAAMKSRTSYFLSKEEPLNKKCGAPLANGSLCGRMDRIKCPFHGKIVERDCLGRPLDPVEQEKDIKRRHAKENIEREAIQKEIDAALGTSLSKKKKRKKTETPANITKRRYGRLTKIDSKNKGPSKMAKKVFSSRAVNKIYETMHSSNQRLHDDKFGSNFNYLH